MGQNAKNSAEAGVSVVRPIEDIFGGRKVRLYGNAAGASAFPYPTFCEQSPHRRRTASIRIFRNMPEAGSVSADLV
jgi:hypothetical protein